VYDNLDTQVTYKRNIMFDYEEQSATADENDFLFNSTFKVSRATCRESHHRS
jgi:hypothetical protein